MLSVECRATNLYMPLLPSCTHRRFAIRGFCCMTRPCSVNGPMLLQTLSAFVRVLVVCMTREGPVAI